MSKIPPLLIVSGDQDLLRRRFVAQVVSAQQAAGWSVEEVPGEDTGAVRVSMEGNPFLAQDVLCVVRNPHKLPLEMLERHHESKDSTTTLLLHIEGLPDGRTKFGKFVKANSGIHKSFPKPKEWEAPKVATQFVLDELKSLGKTISEPIAGALVKRVGPDLGQLVFECRKLAWLVSGSEVAAADVAGAMASVSEAALVPIQEALSLRDTKRLVRALDRVKQTSQYDPTMRVTRFLGATVQTWIQVVYLEHLPPKVAAEEIGMNAWFFENKVLPAVRQWGKKGVVELARCLAESERAVLQGSISPWVVLEAGLIAAVQSR